MRTLSTCSTCLALALLACSRSDPSWWDDEGRPIEGRFGDDKTGGAGAWRSAGGSAGFFPQLGGWAGVVNRGGAGNWAGSSNGASVGGWAGAAAAGGQPFVVGGYGPVAGASGYGSWPGTGGYGPSGGAAGYGSGPILGGTAGVGLQPPWGGTAGNGASPALGGTGYGASSGFAGMGQNGGTAGYGASPSGGTGQNGGTAGYGASPSGGMGQNGGTAGYGASPSGGMGQNGGTAGFAAAGGTAGAAGIGGGPCTSSLDCADTNPCTEDLCQSGQCLHPALDQDRDGFPSLACAGQDCNDRNAAAYPGAPELCSDGADNDCNGVTDCFDPACVSVPGCGCVAVPEQCNNGLDDDCDATVDCLDADCHGSPGCGCSSTEAGACQNAEDDDCDSLLDCDDPDCAADPWCNCSASEDCYDGIDDDCDGLVDCADPTCAWVYPCVCAPPGVVESCDNTADDDCDGRADCADPDCLLMPNCMSCVAELCNDGLDNDCDGAIDCADTACFLSAACPVQPEQCNNQRDDDFDGLADCADPDCAHTELCAEQQGNCLTPEIITQSGTWQGSTVGTLSDSIGTCGGAAGEAVFQLELRAPSRVHLDTYDSSFDVVMYIRAGDCGSGIELGCDDDSAGNWDSLLEFDLLQPGTYFIYVDGLMVDPWSGPDEGLYVLNVELSVGPTELCSDGVDNDGDLLADCVDPECGTTARCVGCRGGLDAEPEFGALACTDGLDNDCDGTIDCQDDDCSASEVNTTECCDGLDDNGNGIADDFNCRCRDDNDCPSGQLCYTHTKHVCGIPCSSFIGDICPSESPGSSCNYSTEQCEF